ncbi:Hypothetical predicted protein, partial [Paramuricea clavata]
LELAVSDTIKAVDGTQPIEDFFGRIYTIYSQSAKLQRELKNIAAELDVQLRKVDKILTTRWVASSSRAVESFWRNYPALYKHFHTLSQSNDKHKATYAGLVKRMETIEFVEDVAIMKDCLGQLSILSESLQKDRTTLLKASDYLQWTINALEKIKDSLETKYEFRNIYDSSVEFKGVELKSFQSRTGYKSFNRKQFLQGLIDNLQRRMIVSSEKILLNQIESLCPEKWSRGEKIPWLKGEQDVISLCERFNINATGIVTSYREFFNDPRNIPSLVEERLLKGLIQIVPVSSAEAERGFSQMNLVCTKSSSSMSVSHLSSLMFISINGPPVQFWEASLAVQQWLEHHKSAENNQTRKMKQTTEAELTPLQRFF